MEQDGGGAHGVTARAPQRELITLVQPRPGEVRRQNEYIDTPFRPPAQAPKIHRKTWRKADGASACHHPITDQPAVKASVSPTDPASSLDAHGDSIICRQCHQCRCEACRSPRLLPSRWICNDKCLCSGATAMDYCSCMCCVRGLFYHWAKDYEMDTDVSCADQPCSCSPHKRFLRWCCLGILAVPLPCLCCYWPLRGCLDVCQWCYTKYSGRGCRCAPARTPAAPDKRLLDTNSDC